MPIATCTVAKASGLRATIADYLTDTKITKASTLMLEQTKESNRAAERARELAIDEEKLKIEAKKEDRASKTSKVMFKLLMRFSKKTGMDLSDSDDE